MIAISIALMLPMVTHACFVSNVIRPSEENIDKKFVYDMKPILNKISVNDSYSELWENQSYKLGESYYLRYNEEDIFLVDRNDEERSDITTMEVVDVINRDYGSNFTIRGAQLRETLMIQIDPRRGMFIYEREPVKRKIDDGSSLNILASKKCIDRERKVNPTCAELVSSGNKYKSAHNCGNQGGKGYQCSRPQGPSGDEVGVCCYTLNTAKSCQYEGGTCFTEKTKNTCGTNC